ncbi:hypothetical protein H6784_05690 [Candidatus Nomurabacteria bacterium]|nr:hypothetical protein [Candidatus Kaiserbacteria bacterium]MCB9814869.1 hypothetical protein [Candidatus Nomurabacteria bacterium]
MKRTYMWLGLLALVLIGGMLLLNNSSEYVVVVDQEVDELQGELASLEAAVVAGTLTPEAAVEAQTKITKRLETINQSIQKGQKAKLTEAQKTQLNDGLERLKNILVKYQATLVAVDYKVENLSPAEKTKLKSRSSKSLTQTVIDSITEAEDTVAEMVEGYDETPIEDLFEEEDSSDEEMLGEQSTTTTEENDTTEMGDESDSADPQSTEVEETQDDSATSTEETSVDEVGVIESESIEAVEDETATSS